MLAYTVISGPALGATAEDRKQRLRVAGTPQALCGLLQLDGVTANGIPICDILYTATDIAGVNLDKIVGEALNKGKSQFQQWVVDEVWSAARIPAGVLYDKIADYVAGKLDVEVSTGTPKPPSGKPRVASHLLNVSPKAVTTVVATDRAAKTTVKTGAEVFKQPLTWAVIGGVAVVGIAAFLLVRK